jgi:hypothetical protein
MRVSLVDKVFEAVTDIITTSEVSDTELIVFLCLVRNVIEALTETYEHDDQLGITADIGNSIKEAVKSGRHWDEVASDVLAQSPPIDDADKETVLQFLRSTVVDWRRSRLVLLRSQ